MSQLPNNSSFYPVIEPSPTDYGQTYHKQSFETDGLSNHLNINNDSSGNWTGSNGGFNFATINSTLTDPIPLATIDISGITIDKSTGGNIVYSPNVFALSDNGRGIVFPSGTNLTLPPYNMTQTFNPIYMTQTTALYNTGTLCYAVLADNESIQIFNNDNINNPIPPAVVPSDFGNSSNIGITTGIPVFSLSLPLPTITKISNLNDVLTIIDDTDTSILSSTDLTFNNISLKNQVETNTNNINTINTNISGLDELIIKQTTVVNQGLSLAIFADGRPALAPTATISQQYAFTPSWYFKNTFVGNNKINWYCPGSIGMTVSQVLGIYMNIFNGLTTSNDNSPFIVIYTQPQAGDPNFYRSKRVYIFNQSIQPTPNTRYFMFSNVSGNCPTPYTTYASTLINMQLSTVAGSNVGPFAPTELILAFAISTNSASALNSVEFAINKFGVMTPSGTQELLFIPI